MAYLPLPDGSVVTIREGENPDQTWARAIREYPEAFGYKKEAPEDDQDKSGFKAAASAGTSRLQGGLGLLAGKMGLMDSDKAEAYDKAKAAEANARFTPTKDSWIESPWQKLKETAGGSLPNMAATMGVGALGALAAPVVGLGAVAGTVGAAAAGAASTAAFTGAHLQRQMEDGKSLDEASGTKAFMAAIPAAALDVISMRMFPVLGKLFGAAGKEITEEGAKALVKQTVAQKARDYALSTGKVMGVEGATEAAQAVIERAQAGLNITDADARNEYFENFMGGAALAGAIGPGGRYIERGREKREGEKLEQERLKKEQERLQREREAANAANAKTALTPSQTPQLPYNNAGAPQLPYEAPPPSAPLAPPGPPRLPYDPEGPQDTPPAAGPAPMPPMEAPAPAAPLPSRDEAKARLKDVAQQYAAADAQLKALEEERRAAIADAPSPRETLQVAEIFDRKESFLKEQLAQLKSAQGEAQSTAATVAAPTPTETLLKLGRAWQTAKDKGEYGAATKLAARITALEDETGIKATDLLQARADEKAARLPGAVPAQPAAPMAPTTPVPEMVAPAAPEPTVQAPVAEQEVEDPPPAPPLPDAAQRAFPTGAERTLRLGSKRVQAPAVSPLVDAPAIRKRRLELLAAKNADPSSKMDAGQDITVNNDEADQLTDLQERQTRSRARELKDMTSWEELRNPEASRPWDALPERVKAIWMTAGERGVQRMELADRLAKLTNDAALPAEPKKTPEPEARSPGRAPAPLDKMLGAATANRLEPDDAALVERVRDKQALLEKDKNAVADINAWLYRTLMAGPNPEGARDVKGYLDTLDRAGTSETEQTRGRVAKRELTDDERAAIRGNTPGMLPGEEFRGNRHIGADGKPTMGRPIKETFENTTTKGSIDTAQQADMFADPDLQGAIYDSPEQFQEALTSETAQQRRAQRGRESDDADFPAKRDPEADRQRVLKERRDTGAREKQKLLELQQADGKRRVSFVRADNRMNELQVGLNKIDARTDKILDSVSEELTPAERSAQLQALGKQRAKVRAAQQKLIDANKRKIDKAHKAAARAWAEVATLEAKPKARNKAARLVELNATAKALEEKANELGRRHDQNQSIVEDQKDRARALRLAAYYAQEAAQKAKDRAEGVPSPVLDKEVNQIAKGQQKWQPDEDRVEQTEDEARAATLKRAIGPDTRPVSSAPNKFRTGNSDANEGSVDKRIKTERGTQQAKIEIRKKEMEASNKDSAAFAKAKKAREEVAEAEKKAETIAEDVRDLAAEKDAQTNADVAAIDSMAATPRRFAEGWDDADNNMMARASAYETAARNSTPLNEATAAAAAQGNLMSAVQDLAKNAKDGFVREAAAKLLPFLANTKVEVVNEVKVRGKVVDAKYDPKTNTITLSRALMSEETLLHEAVHAATIAAIDADPKTLTSEQRAALKDLQALFDRIKKDAEFSGEYGETDLKEFVSEVLSNKQLRDKLDNKVGYERSPLRAIWDAIAKFFGFETKGGAAQTSEQIYKLFQPSEKLQTADTVSSILRGVFPGRGARYSDTVSKEVQDITNASIGRQAALGDKLTAINSGLAWRTAIADRWAPIEALVKRGVSKGIIKEVQALQLRLHMRNHEQAGQYVSTAATQGVPQLRDQDGLLYGDPKSQAKNGKGTYAMASAPGANIKQIAEALTKANVGNEEATEMLFTQWMAVQRGKLVGFDKLNYTRELTPAQIKAIDDTVANDEATKDAFNEARKIYKQYNTDLMNLAVQAGLISKDTAAYYLKGDYVPFYRIEGNAVVMDLGTSKPITIGNVIDQPHLKELVGGNDKLLPFFDGAMQNTSMIIRTALRNMQTKDTTAMLRDLGYAVIHKEENGKTGPNGSIRFKHEGEQFWAELDKDVFAKDGIPAEVVLQGMQGIKTAVPGLVKLMSGPANFLRKTVTRMPLYALRQMIRDPLHAWLTTGGNFTPVLSSFKELAKVMKGESETDMMLKRAGVISSNVFTGDEQDTARILRDISTSKTPLNQALAKLDAFAMAADATTRAVLYDSFRKQGMGHHEALLNTLESMNFSRRGTSASLHWLGAMVPFFNAQIQGADAVYRSLKGDTSFEQKMDARNVLLKRGALIAASTMAYAMLMQDDEAYKNATPEERAMNWFLRVPGLDEPVRVPIPFELGLIFKAIPEAAINVAFGDTKLEAGMKAIGKQLWMSTPLSLPTAINPAVELAANYSFFTDQPIESQRERGLTADQRYRPGTTEAAKLLGSLGVLSPVQVEHLVRGYTGGVGLTLMAAADLVLRPLTGADEVAKPDRKNSELAVIGPLFQPNTGRGIINEAFNDIERFQQAHQSYKKLLESGERAEAAAFASKFSREIALASTGGAFRQQMGELATLKRNIAANREMSGEQKREQIERLKQVEITLAQRIKQLATAE